MTDTQKETNLRYKDLLKFGYEKMLNCDDSPLFPFTIDKFTSVIVNRQEKNFVVDLGNELISKKIFKPYASQQKILKSVKEALSQQEVA